MSFDELHDISSVGDGEVNGIEKHQIVMENLERAFDEWGDGFGQVVQRCLKNELRSVTAKRFLTSISEDIWYMRVL